MKDRRNTGDYFISDTKNPEYFNQETYNKIILTEQKTNDNAEKLNSLTKKDFLTREQIDSEMNKILKGYVSWKGLITFTVSVSVIIGGIISGISFLKK